MNGATRLAGAAAIAGLALGACGGTVTATPTSTSTAGGTVAPGPTTTTTAAANNMSGTNSLPKTGARVKSVDLTGTTAQPVVTVSGSGFGTRPTPYPSTAPEGQSGCPAAPTAGDGYLYGNKLFLADPNTITGFIAGEDAGGQFDCVGLVIDSWSPSKVVFSLGNLYDKHIPQNYYVLKHGDPFTVYVQGAVGTGSVLLAS